MSVGVVVLDDAHEKLVAPVDALHDGIQAGKAAGALGHVLDGPISDTAADFELEEEFIAETGHPATAAPKQEQAALTKQGLDVQAEYKAGASGTLSLEVMNFLETRLISHIQGSDKRYGGHLNAAGIK